MNLREIAELAVLTARYSRTDSSIKVPDDRLACFIRYTRLRTHVWHLCIEQLQESPSPQQYTQLFQEVLVSELLTQVVQFTVLSREHNIGRRMTENVTSIRRILEQQRKSLPSFVQALKIQRLQRRLEHWLNVLRQDGLKSEVDFAVAMATIRIATPDVDIIDERRAAVQRAVWDSVLDLVAWRRNEADHNQLRDLILAGSTCN